MNNYFLFIIPRTPLEKRTPLRQDLWELCKKSLLNQTSKNWKAIIVGDSKEDELDPNHFLTINYTENPKHDKLIKALEYIENELEIKPAFLIRLDDDDLISPSILEELENKKIEFDCFTDRYHTYIDPCYLKISHSKGNWIPNTAIHKYEHAIKPCGPFNIKLILQDHAMYWHIYYSDKNVLYARVENPLYYRILSPTSITSGSILKDNSINWHEHLKYLTGYGPWININRALFFYEGISNLSAKYFSDKPKKSIVFWIFNYLKYGKNNLLNVFGKKFNSENHNSRNADVEVAIESDKHTECSRCILSTKEVKNISFNKDGLCNYCAQYDDLMQSLGNKEQRLQTLNKIIAEIKQQGLKNKYNCILGVSGGVDSSYLAYWAKQNKLNPLVVHFDNGWDSEQATQNIHNICKKLGFELQTIVVDWEEFKELQLSYLHAGVIDIEALTDHAIYATILKIAKKYKIKYVLSGFNDSTEGIMPRGWAFDKRDWKNIKDIYEKFGKGKKLKTYPHVTFFEKLYYYWFLKIETIKVLNYIDYDKEEAKKIIKENIDWKDLGGKHFESIFTKFYQLYILPKKFKVDKRLAHLASLVCSGQITKSEARKEYELPLYDESKILVDKEYIVKKLGLSIRDFDVLISLPPRKYNDFETEKKLWERYFKLIRLLKFKK